MPIDCPGLACPPLTTSRSSRVPLQVSTVDEAGQTAVATSDAVTLASPSETMITSGGRSYKVRERPPSYFALESERISERAREELARMTVSQPPALTAPTAARAPKAMLVLVRHGTSDYNRENVFTGWADCDLTNRGKEEVHHPCPPAASDQTTRPAWAARTHAEAEDRERVPMWQARFAGSLLREAGVLRVERVYTSVLKRAIKTAWLMLDELELQYAARHASSIATSAPTPMPHVSKVDRTSMPTCGIRADCALLACSRAGGCPSRTRGGSTSATTARCRCATPSHLYPPTPTGTM